MKNNYFNQFLKSALQLKGEYISTKEALDWLKNQNHHINVKIEKTSFANLNEWNYNDETGSLHHKTGKFFSVEGIRINTNWGEVSQWEQPIINQPEVGYLGLIAKEIRGILHFLMQAKIEPGNVNHVQLSPTIQATRSNFTQVHKGKKPLYLEYFQQAGPQQILLDQLQSEQGGRFLKKRNRNIIIKTDDDITINENFIWLTLGQIKDLMRYNNVVNMDTRTVISGISFDGLNEDISVVKKFKTVKSSAGLVFIKSAMANSGALNSIEDIITFLTKLKSNFDLDVTKLPLKKLAKWIYNDYEIQHQDYKYFKVIAVDIEIGNREVVKWNQPMIEPAQEGLCAFVCKEINGILHFAVQAKLECGNFDIIEFAPTVQCLTGNYKQTKEGALPFLDYILNVPKEQVYYDVMQSEEGGRFFREQNRNMIIFAGSEISIELPPNYIWMTLNQLFTFIKFNNYLNVQARSLIAAISYF